ncbi:Flp family type IVb pilin [Geomesophilobacter sediminis]|uniref:Flp family type IVb pilin n=1 Tax=Geomesophilobacter sediminis TaxID=2798584 RepID=A0A8J7LYY3_9BACT|nr:Flp family type IVb pilin [Geomesophilobacter sediminis]MBJ6725722.1 Flp family type IVb pilin [Geomesophilobacter sediminis]
MKLVIGTYLRMQEAREKMKSMLKEEKGATMVEYALMVALIAVIAMAGAKLLGQDINSQFNTVAGKVASP